MSQFIHWTCKILAAMVVVAGMVSGGSTRVVASDDEPTGPVSNAPDPAARLLAAVKDQPTPPSAVSREKPSEAEYIARLQRAIDADKQQLEDLTCQQDERHGEYGEADEAFRGLDAKHAELRAQIADLKRDGGDEVAADLEKQLAALESKWQSAKERFDLAIKQRKAVRDKVVSLQEKIDKDTQTLNSLTKTPQDVLAEPAAPPAAAPQRQPTPPTPGDAPPESSNAAGAVLKMSPALGGLEAATQAVEAADKKRPTLALLEAQAEAEAKRGAAVEADEKLKIISERFEALKKNIAAERALLDVARAQADQSQQDWAALNQALRPTLAENPAGLKDLTKKIEEAGQRFAAARRESQASQQRLNDLQTQLSAVQQEKIEAVREAAEKHADADDAQEAAEQIQNPFTLVNMAQWLLDHGARIIAILLGTLAIYLSVRLVGRHLTKVVARTSSRGTLHERQNRAITLVGVLRNVVSITVIASGLLMLLDEVGIPIAPLMGGAAVVGLAVAFGAQNMVRDYFSGFMVLMEDQYGINDVVKIGEIAGAVEQITLRVTRLRDLEGTVHFIPHGSITTVSNMTHGWSRALMEIGIAYKEDADRVMDVLLDVARTLRQDAEFGPYILADAEMLGVDAFGDSAIVIKMCVKTQPLKRWAVKRELLRRIKHKFDELGIEIPFPHRTLFLRRDESEALEKSLPHHNRDAA